MKHVVTHINTMTYQNFNIVDALACSLLSKKLWFVCESVITEIRFS